MSSAKLLAEIHKAQEATRNGYQTALAEIRAGQKRSCWIWYIWPCLAPVRVTSRPHYSLPDLQAAAEFVRHDSLGSRLMEITEAAVDHLSRGSKPNIVFGSSTDAQKFHESATCFAVVAAEAKDVTQLELWCRALESYSGALEEKTMSYVVGTEGLVQYRGVASAAQLLAAVRAAEVPS
eukprot:gb/GFBE01059860.1/.p1 GENE.gb/GFBE01059860.1/~~gb/GFBE01059860.1/.p1  ORF type:complete len:179 (+),score=30.81 gb/GFBE01059860.1/:1-537(+)